MWIASKLRGVMSYGMVLCAKNEDGSKVEFVSAPTGSAVGDRIVVEEFRSSFSDDLIDGSVNIKKKTNAWTPSMPLLKTNKDRVACFKGYPLHSKNGACTAPTLTDALIS